MAETAVQACRDFCPTFAAEKLAEIEGIPMIVSVLRRYLIASRDWKGLRQSKEYRSRRERRECVGKLVQFDGSRRLKSDISGLQDAAPLLPNHDDRRRKEHPAVAFF
jgi:hypothetical protein